nr:Zinc finger FLYWCH type [Hymenolepis microstoma]
MITTASMPTNTETTPNSLEYAKMEKSSAVVVNGQAGKLDKWSLMEVSVGFDVTRKGERSLVINGYKFTKSRDGMSDRVFWRCSRRECKATAVTVGERLEHVRILHDHERPPSGEFYAATTPAVTVATATAAATLTSPSGQRIRRRSSNQLQQSVRGASQQVKSGSSPPPLRNTLLEQKQPPVSTVEGEINGKSDNGVQPQLPSAEVLVAAPPAVKHSTFAEIDSRGLSTLADAAASQLKRDSQNSTPDPPCEASVASSSSQTTLPSGVPFLLLGPRDLTSTVLIGGTNTPEGPPLLTTPSPYFSSSCTRRFSVSEVPISARSCLPRSPLQVDQYPSLRTPKFHEAAAVAGVRGALFPASTGGGGGMLLHWKKEKMLESKAEEEKAEKEQLQQQQNFGRRRYYTASPSSTARAGTVVAAPASTSLMATLPGCDVVATDEKDTERPTLKRKRCASDCHPPPVSAPHFCPSSTSPINNLSVPSIDPPTMITPSSPQAVDWYIQVHNELQTQMYTTIRQLLARVNAAEGTENVVALCSAMTACLDTIAANKRARLDLPPPLAP